MKIIYDRWVQYFRSEGRRIFHKYSLPRWMVFILDSGAIFLTFLFAYLLRFNFETSAVDFTVVFRQSLVVLSVYCLFEVFFKSFTGLIRHTTIRDIFNVLMATFSSVMILTAMSLLAGFFGKSGILNIPVSIILIHFVSISVFLFLIRISIKIVYEFISVTPEIKKNVFIFGAGVLGVTTKGVIESDAHNEYNIIGFLDNDRKLQGKKISGIPVMDPAKLSRDLLVRSNVKTMIFAIKNIVASEKAEIYKFAVDLGLEVLEIPGASSWFNGRFQLDQLKKIDLNDLLGREPIKLDLELIDDGLRGKTILVTGAAGSIGSEMVRQLSRFDVRKLILVDQAETPMFHLERELSNIFGHVEAVMVIGDVTNQEKMESVFYEHRPDLVFHAAAYKHVPLMEENPHEAVRVNVGGTMVVSAMAIKYRVKKFVMISTDKAVNPANVMGASKRLCEMVIESRSRNPENHLTQFVITRFGNVLGSNGSVIPIFKKQIEEGGPVTVTHPDITRYFMTIPEACQLVLEAGFMGKGGEIYVFDMGKPVRILDLAKRMIRLSGYEPGKDIQIEFSGLRPGEKLYEELLADRENTLPTYNPKINIAQVETTDFMVALEAKNLLGFLYSYTNFELVEKLKDLVPEYRAYTERYDGSHQFERTAI
jgi:FlaA1/EpsC-like NDP-sugar epimerase